MLLNAAHRHHCVPSLLPRPFHVGAFDEKMKRDHHCSTTNTLCRFYCFSSVSSSPRVLQSPLYHLQEISFFSCLVSSFDPHHQKTMDSILRGIRGLMAPHHHSLVAMGGRDCHRQRQDVLRNSQSKTSVSCFQRLLFLKCVDSLFVHGRHAMNTNLQNEDKAVRRKQSLLDMGALVVLP